MMSLLTADPSENVQDIPEGRSINVELSPEEAELLDAVFYHACCPEEAVIQDDDWKTLVGLAKKLGSGDLRQL